MSGCDRQSNSTTHSSRRTPFTHSRREDYFTVLTTPCSSSSSPRQSWSHRGIISSAARTPQAVSSRSWRPLRASTRSRWR
eukprot:50839-Prymnesium_polylepis.1